jgi:octaprenyl-diphosphate synthase
MLRDVIEQGGTEHLDDVLRAIESTDAIEYTARLAKQEAAAAKRALQPLPDNSFRAALEALADFSVARTF